jgi:hypothetical protein
MNGKALLGGLLVVLGAAGLGGLAGWDWRDARAQRERAAAVEDALKEEAALRGRMEESHERTLEELARLRIDRADLDRAGRDLRVRLAGAVAAARAAPASGGEAAPGDGDPIGVLAGVLERADATAAELADFADRSRAAGLACERSFDALRRR